MPVCCKVTRNKTNLLCARALKNRPKRKETSILSRRWKLGLWLWPRNKATVIPVEESPSCHPRELRQMKSDFKSMLPVFLNSEAILQKKFFSSLPACESTVLRRSTKGFYGSCWEKMSDKCRTQDWLLYHDNTPCHTDSWLFPVSNLKKMVMVSGLCTTPSWSSWFILVLIDRNMVKEMKIQGYYEAEAELQAALERIAKQEFWSCF